MIFRSGYIGENGHLFKWTDECLVEEIEDMKSLISDMNKYMSELRINVARLKKDFEGMKTESERKGDEYLSEVWCGV